jgi:hypothetical protein
MVRFAFVAVLAAILLCGCVPPGRGAENDAAAALALAAAMPKATAKVEPVGCQCPNGGPCTCDATGCDCPGCSCASCPGRSTAGIAPNEDDAIASARLHRCPLVAFVNTPARSVPGAISYAVRKPGQGPWAWAGGSSGGVGRPATATNAELLQAAAPYLNAAPMSAGPQWQPFAPQAMTFAPMAGCPGGL